ncbi:uncharacterized protein LOC128884009 isoform X2 [Hylaeus volcanicus]|uniref:uncharacterized protein LOC128884009 isoform X2 n=1 Tax=Hylaeus volcanicus TaxID=313075 RepID=UPI0023B835AE|nr:uncharacterized protein LOC128884009 isoform X2 [Hylaeus volcanicus]
MCDISESQWNLLLQTIHQYFQANQDVDRANVPVALCDDIFAVWFFDDRYFHFLASILNTEFLFLHSQSATSFHSKALGNFFFHEESPLTSQIDSIAPPDLTECEKDTLMNGTSSVSTEIAQMASNCLIPLLFSRFCKEASVSSLYKKKNCLVQAPVEYTGEFLDIDNDFISQKNPVGSALAEPLFFLNDLTKKKATAQSNKLYQYLFVERSCSPLPFSFGSLFPLFLNKMLLEHSIKLPVPIVLMVNDESPEVYNWNQLLSCFDENVTSEGIEEDDAEINNLQGPLDMGSMFTATDSVEGDIAFQNSATPAPIPRKLTARDDSHLLPHDAALWSFESVESLTKARSTDQHKCQHGEDTLNSLFQSHLNWSLFSRATHLCFLPTSLCNPFQQESMQCAASSVNSDNADIHQFIEQTQENGINAYTGKAPLTKEALFNYILVKVPVLPQEQMFFPLFSGSSRKLSRLPIGNFFLKCLPEKIMHFTALLSSLKEEKDHEQQNEKRSTEVYTQKSVLNMLGSVNAKCRYDLIQNPPYFDKLYSLKEGSIEKQVLCNRIGVWSVQATQGPLVSLQASWTINDVWTTTMYPFFPTPDTASFESNVLESTISFRTGAGKDTYLFWMWSDLEILQNLKNIRTQLDTNQSSKQTTDAPSESPLKQPLHTKENIFFALYNACNESTLRKTTTDQLESLSQSYQPMEKNEILSHVHNFLKIQRHLGEATVKRRVGHSMNSTGLQGNNDHSLHLETRKLEGAHPTTCLYAEALHSNHGLFPPARSDTDFSDHLWHFIRRSFDTEDILKVVQIVLDTIGFIFDSGSSTTIHTNATNNEHFSLLGKKELYWVPREPDNLEKTQSIQQPFLPLLRNNSTPILKSLVQIAIKGSQLKRYNRSTSNFDVKTMYHSTSHKASNEMSQDEARIVQENWMKNRAELTSPIKCIDLVCEIGREALFRDAIVIIQEADPSISLATLSWFKEVSPTSDESLQRLSYLHKISELAALARTVKLAWDSTRSLLRHAIELFQRKKAPETLENDPLFVLNLSRQQFRTMLNFWIRQESEILLSLTLPQVVTAVFTRVKGELEKRYLEKNYKVYPVNLANLSDELSEEDTSDNAAHPVYLWKTVQRENSNEKEGAIIENNELSIGGTPPTSFSTAHQHLLYSLKLIYYDPSL